MRKEPTCPYCGCEMIYPAMGCQYECPHCGSKGPDSNDPEEAYVETVQRYDPPEKPLTLAEAKVRNMERLPLYVECSFVERWHGLQPLNEWVVGLGWMRSWGKPDDEPVGFLEEGYGIYWRCWTRNPTDEERRVAVWMSP